jgi:hypothetical protein
MPGAGGAVEPPEALFWVRVTDTENSGQLRPEQPLVLQVGDASTTVLRGLAPLGLLQPSGHNWVRAHGYSSCVFVKYGANPRERFQVRISAA